MIEKKSIMLANSPQIKKKNSDKFVKATPFTCVSDSFIKNVKDQFSNWGNFCDLFQFTANKHPHSIAVKYLNESLSYSKLDELSTQLAYDLIQLGIKPGDIIGVGLFNDIKLIVAFLGILKAGGVYLPLDPNYPTDQLYQMAVSVKLIVINNNSSSIFRTIPIQKHNLDTNQLQTSPLTLPIIPPKQPAYVIYTSGTTGIPKGIVMSHLSLKHAATSFASIFPSPPCSLLASSISFDPSLLTIIHALSTGGSVCLYKNSGCFEDIKAVPDIIKTHKVDFIISTPSFYEKLLSEKQSLFNLKKVVFCGEQVPSKIIDKHKLYSKHANIYNAYGPSEYAIGTSLGLIYDSASKNQYPENIGKPFTNNRLYILDDDLQPVRYGQKGEFFVGGPGLATGYFNQESLTKEQFFNHTINNFEVRLYRTGDIGYQQKDGNFIFCKRKHFQVKSNEKKVEKVLNLSNSDILKKWNINTRSTIIKRAPTHLGQEKHNFQFFAKVDTTPTSFRKNAEDYIADLPQDQSRRFKYTFDSIANHVAFQAQYILGLFKPDSSLNTLLDIGCGPGIIAKPLLPYFKHITGVDCDSNLAPYLTSIEKKKNFTFIPGKFQNIHFKKKYDHILCNHSIYYIPQEQWKQCISKMLDLLEVNGSILLVQTAPLGPLHDIRKPINPNYPHSGHMHNLLEKMGITYSTEVFVFEHPQPSRESFRDLVHMYMVDGCYPPDGYNTSPSYTKLTNSKKERLDTLVEGFVSGCYDYTENVYKLHDVCHYIKIDKQ